jgi:hypothetical protein
MCIHDSILNKLFNYISEVSLKKEGEIDISSDLFLVNGNMHS